MASKCWIQKDRSGCALWMGGLPVLRSAEVLKAAVQTFLPEVWILDVTQCGWHCVKIDFRSRREAEAASEHLKEFHFKGRTPKIREWRSSPQCLTLAEVALPQILDCDTASLQQLAEAQQKLQSLSVELEVTKAELAAEREVKAQALSSSAGFELQLCAIRLELEEMQLAKDATALKRDELLEELLASQAKLASATAEAAACQEALASSMRDVMAAQEQTQMAESKLKEVRLECETLRKAAKAQNHDSSEMEGRSLPLEKASSDSIAWMLQLAEETVFNGMQDSKQLVLAMQESDEILWRLVLAGNARFDTNFSSEELDWCRGLREGDFSVSISIYDFLPFWNMVLVPSGLGGAFHVGLVIGQREWSFGACEEGSGVSSHEPTKHPNYSFRQSVPLKWASKPRVTFLMHTLNKMRAEYPGRSYELKSRNCLTFAQDLSTRAGAIGWPDWVCLPGYVDHIF